MTKTLTSLLAAALLATLTACGNATVPVTPVPADPQTAAPSAPSAQSASATPSSPVTASTPADQRSQPTASHAAASACSAGSISLQYCPPNFELPAGLDIDVVTQTPEETSLVVRNDGLKNQADFFRSMLAKGGYVIHTDAGGLIAWTGHGWVGNVIDGGVLTWWVDGEVPPVTTPDEAWLTKADLGITAAPFFLRYPAGTTVSALVEKEQGTSYVLGGHSPDEFVTWYREFLQKVHFDVTGQSHTQGGTVIEFTTDDYRSTLTCSSENCTMAHIPL